MRWDKHLRNSKNKYYPPCNVTNNLRKVFFDKKKAVPLPRNGILLSPDRTFRTDNSLLD